MLRADDFVFTVSVLLEIESFGSLVGLDKTAFNGD